MRILSVAVVAMALVTVGCGSGRTVGEYCDATGDAFCARAAACGLDSYDHCFQNFKGGCCFSNGTCNDTMDRGDENLRACVPAINVEECSDVRAGVVPATCSMQH